MIGAPVSVLVVEDERIVAEDLVQTLAELGYEPFAIASSADEAIAIVSERCPDIVLMDIRIRGKRDGIETAGILRARFGVPIVYLTAHADDATIERAKQTEPQGYLLKPVNEAELKSGIELGLFRHEMEKRLRARERWFSTTLHSIADAVITVDLSGVVTFMNPPAEKLTGISASQGVGRPARDVLKLSDVDTSCALETPLDRALRAEEPIELLEASLHAAGGDKWVISDSAARVVDDRDEVLGAVMVFRDVTEQQLMRRQMELSDRLSSLGTMAAGVAHELNNPLSVVLANAVFVSEALERLRKLLPTEARGSELAAVLQETRTMHEESRTAIERIRRIVGDLKSFSRPAESGSDDAEIERAVRWAIRSTSHELRHRAEVTFEGGHLPNASIDEIRLGQVLVNLLINAAHAIAPGDVAHNRVSIRARVEDARQVVIEVQDTGAGMSPDVLKRVFDPFFTTKPVGTGTGLGMSICHGIIRSAGGEIRVESARGVGTTVRLELPIARVTPPPSSVPPRPSSEALRGRILVVDDEPMVLSIVRRVLSLHDVVCAQAAEDAIALLQRGERFDLILSDLTMPSMTGVGFYEWLLCFDPELRKKLVFMSGGAVTDKMSAFLRSIPNLCVQKPFDVGRLQRAVQKALESAQGSS